MVSDPGQQVWGQKYNCFAYAVSGAVPVSREDLPSAPGFKSGRGVTINPLDGAILNAVKLTDKLRADGLIKARDITPRAGHYIIAAYIAGDNYHFVKQDAQGGWSHKNGWGNAPENLGELTEDDIKISKPFSGENDKYHFAGFFYVPNIGLSVIRNRADSSAVPTGIYKG